MTTQHAGEHGHRIVVGVDGSDQSKAALAWAVREAALTGATVDAVIAWEFPANYGYPVPAPPVLDYPGLATKVVARAVAAVLSTDERVIVSPQVVEGNAAQVLLDAAAGADLLVVGSHGHSGFVGALLGSVSQHCVHHAACPVAVIRG